MDKETQTKVASAKQISVQVPLGKKAQYKWDMPGHTFKVDTDLKPQFYLSTHTALFATARNVENRYTSIAVNRTVDTVL